MKRRKKAKRTTSLSRRVARRLTVVSAVVLVLWGGVGDWFVHHPRTWLDHVRETWPEGVVTALFWLGNPIGDITDGLALTGRDVVYEYDEQAPVNTITFSGVPKRTGAPAPADIRVLNRGEFLVGWSDTLRHAVWCAYHVTKVPRYEDGKRPSFLLDREVPRAPRSDAYTKSGFDRGHMVPNHAIVSRYGNDVRRRTFLMTNIAPQSPQLNRGVWRDVEHRIADLWTARYGEIWVVVGAIPSSTRECLPGSDIDLPTAYYQIILAQEGLDVRALAVLFPQNVPWDDWAARHIVTIDELEALTGLDFNPDMPAFLQDPLEAELPTRLWPVRVADIFRQILLRFM